MAAIIMANTQLHLHSNPIILQNGQNHKEVNISPQISERKLPSIRKLGLERSKSIDTAAHPIIAPLINLDINANSTFTKSFDSKKREKPFDPDVGRELKQKIMKIDNSQFTVAQAPQLNTSNGSITPLKKSSSGVGEVFKSHHDILRKHNEEKRIKLAKSQAVQNVQHRPALYIGIESYCGNLIVPVLPTYLADEKSMVQSFSFEEA